MVLLLVLLVNPEGGWEIGLECLHSVKVVRAKIPATPPAPCGPATIPQAACSLPIEPPTAATSIEPQAYKLSHLNKIASNSVQLYRPKRRVAFEVAELRSDLSYGSPVVRP